MAICVIYGAMQAKFQPSGVIPIGQAEVFICFASVCIGAFSVINIISVYRSVFQHPVLQVLVQSVNICFAAIFTFVVYILMFALYVILDIGCAAGTGVGGVPLFLAGGRRFLGGILMRMLIGRILLCLGCGIFLRFLRADRSL